MIKGILFDKDGTLIEFHNVWHNITGKILEELNKNYNLSKELIGEIKVASGYQENGFSKESIIQYYATSQIAEMWYRIINKSNDTSSISCEEIMEIFKEKAMDEDVEIKALEGVQELLFYLKSKNYKLGVATADTMSSTVSSLQKADILHYFDYIGCDEEGIHPKPASDMALRFCVENQLKPENILIVGDSVTDMLFAENAGASFIGIKTPYNDHEKFTEHNKIMVENVKDIIIYLHL